MQLNFTPSTFVIELPLFPHVHIQSHNLFVFGYKTVRYLSSIILSNHRLTCTQSEMVKNCFLCSKPIAITNTSMCLKFTLYSLFIPAIYMFFFILWCVLLFIFILFLRFCFLFFNSLFDIYSFLNTFKS